MADNLTREQRSKAMRKVKAKDTSPEIAVRHLLRTAGKTGYRLHRKDLPGKPDIAFIGRRTAIFVHGCFWHGHDCSRGARKPKENAAYWSAKIERNQTRDRKRLADLAALGWRSVVVWECELQDPAAVLNRLMRFLERSDGERGLVVDRANATGLTHLLSFRLSPRRWRL